MFVFFRYFCWAVVIGVDLVFVTTCTAQLFFKYDLARHPSTMANLLIILFARIMYKEILENGRKS
jgi:hypothetical protein